MTPTDPLKEAIAWADNIQDCVGVPVSDKNNAATLAAAVRSRDEEIARLRSFHELCAEVGDNARKINEMNAGLRSLLKTAEEEMAGLRVALYEIHTEADAHGHETGALLRASVSIIRAKARKALATKTGEKL